MPLLGDVLCLALHVPLGDSDDARAERAVQLDHVDALGVRMVRRDVRWDAVEPQPGELHWEQVDPGLNEILDRGVEVVALLSYGVPWASSRTDDDPFYPPDDPEDFARFAGRVAERYAGRIRLYEIWNEPNAGFRFWKPTVGGDPAAYGALLRAAAREIRSADPGALVVYGGTFFHAQIVNPSTMEFLEAHFEALPYAADDFDAVAFHPYPWYPPSVPPEEDAEPEMEFWRMAEEIRAVLADHGAGGRPLYATEYGWPVYDNVTGQVQAAWLVRGALWLSAVGVRSACWYTLNDGRNTGGYPPESDFGLISYDVNAQGPGPPKPAYYAMQTLSATLGETGFVRDAGGEPVLEGDGYALLFASRDGRVNVHVLWTRSEGQTAVARIPKTGGQVAAHDAFGEPVSLEESAEAYTVSFGFLPLYVVDVEIDAER